jgi:hypothetical protein
MEKLGYFIGKLIPLLLLIGLIGFCVYLGYLELDIVSFYNAISHSLIYKIFFFFYLVWLLLSLLFLPFYIYEGIKYYFTDLHKYNQEDELNAETKEIRKYIKLRRGG